MKKLLLITILSAIAMGNLYAQFKTTKTIKNTQNLNQSIPPPPPPPTTNKTAAPISNTNAPASVYKLTSARVNIRTGNDNKEFPSAVRVSIGVRGGNMEYAYFLQENLKNEMKSNSNTEFGLEKSKGYLKDITLDVLQNTGFHLRIAYTANFQLDAWKIEGVSATIEFRDQNGNLHPTLGQKTITFSNANGFLNGYPGGYYMICNTDGYFNPLSAFTE